MAHEINGAFDKADEETKNLVMEIVAMFHHRNVTHHQDGSRGEIKITLRQLNDALSYVAKHRAE